MSTQGDVTGDGAEDQQPLQSPKLEETEGQQSAAVADDAGQIASQGSKPPSPTNNSAQEQSQQNSPKVQSPREQSAQDDMTVREPTPVEQQPSGESTAPAAEEPKEEHEAPAAEEPSGEPAAQEPIEEPSVPAAEEPTSAAPTAAPVAEEPTPVIIDPATPRQASPVVQQEDSGHAAQPPPEATPQTALASEIVSSPTENTTIPPPPPAVERTMSSLGGDKLAPDALNLSWSFGMNKNIPVINLTDDSRKMIMYACAHTGVLYDFHGNQQLLLQGHANAIACTCVSMDKRWLATADTGHDNMVIVWDSFTGIPVRNIFEPHPDVGVVAMAMTPDAKYLATLSGGDAQIFSIWDWTVESDGPVCSVQLQDNFGLQNYILFNPENTSQIVSNSESQVVFYSWKNGELLYTAPPLSDEDFNKPVGKFSQSIFLQNSSRALTASSLGNLVVWDDSKSQSKGSPKHTAPNKKALKLVKLQDRGVSVITTTDDLRSLFGCDSFIVTGDVAGHVKFFDQTLKLANWYQDFHLGPVNSLSFAYLPEFDALNLKGGDFPPDATIRAKPFVVRDFVVGTYSAIYAHVTTDGTDVNVIHKDHDAPVYAMSAHPKEPRLLVGSYSGYLKIWDYEEKMVFISRTFEKGLMIRCCEFDPSGDYIAVGFTNGMLRILDAMTLDDLHPEPFRFARDAITHIAFSHDSSLLATADGDFTVTLLRQQLATGQVYSYLGRYRSHYKPIESLMFGLQLDSNTPRLLSLGQDRVLVEYDLEKSQQDDLRLLSADRIEQSALPHCITWYPPVTKESFLLTANDQFKFKLYNTTTKMCRSTLLGPTYGSPLQKIVILPSSKPSNPKRHLVYITKDKVGLQSLPLDGNPHNAMALVAHPQGVANVVASNDGKYVFTAGGVDATVHVWDINLDALEVQAKLGGEGLIPFYGLLDGGRDGELFKELEDYFYYAQIRSQGVCTMEMRKVSTVIPVSEIPFVMRALGFYPSEQEVDDMLNEVKFSKYVETGEYTTQIDLSDFIKLYINHRPAFGLQADKLAWAFDVLGVPSDTLPSLHRSELLHVLQNRGEHMTELELAEYLTTLLGFNPEGGSSELQEFDTFSAGDIIDENLPLDINADMFANDLLGFGMYADVLLLEKGGDATEPATA